jgi:hypothetical protein
MPMSSIATSHGILEQFLGIKPSVLIDLRNIFL